jgi:hypothetical protein
MQHARTASDEWRLEELAALDNWEEPTRPIVTRLVTVMSKMDGRGNSDIVKALRMVADLAEDRDRRGEPPLTFSFDVSATHARVVFQFTRQEQEQLVADGWPGDFEDRPDFDAAVVEAHASHDVPAMVAPEESDGVPAPEIDSFEDTGLVTMPGNPQKRTP